jgi:hypothetical protein
MPRWGMVVDLKKCITHSAKLKVGIYSPRNKIMLKPLFADIPELFYSRL